MKVKVFFAWYDFWVGGFYDRDTRTLYICPVPMVVIKISRPLRRINTDAPHPDRVKILRHNWRQVAGCIGKVSEWHFSNDGQRIEFVSVEIENGEWAGFIAVGVRLEDIEVLSYLK